MQKFAYKAKMTLSIPDSEKRMAEKAEERFNELKSRLELAIEHLDIAYESFKDLKDPDKNEILKFRRVFLKFRDRVERNFNRIMKLGFRCAVTAGEFIEDPSVHDFLSSYDSYFKEIEHQVNIFLGIFSNIDGDDFIRTLVESIENIKKEVSQLQQLIDDRILEFFQNDVLARDWTNAKSIHYEEEIKERLPLIRMLFEERQKALGDV